MKKITLVIIAVIVLFGSVTAHYILLKKAGFLTGSRAYAQTQDKNTWVVKINDTVITLKDFEREFNVHVYSLPIAAKDKKKYENDINNKKKFLTNLINEYLIYNKAVKDGYLKRQDVQDLIKAVKRRAVIQVYLNEKIEPLLKEVPDEQIEAIYNKNKKLFAGVDIDVARQQIRMQLLQKQYNDHLNEIIDNLKGEAKVVKNEKVGL
jgi:hypothetical protein